MAIMLLYGNELLSLHSVNVQSLSTSSHEIYSQQQLRKRTLENANDSLLKRLKCINNTKDEEIERHRKG